MSSEQTKQLFRSLPIPQIREINAGLETQANEKIAELRGLVGSKYRSLLATADNIIKMNGIMIKQDADLAELSDLQESNLEAIEKHVANYHTFILSRFVPKGHVEISLRLVLVDLETSLANLAVDDTVHLAREFHVLDQAFQYHQIKSSLTQRFANLKARFDNLLTSMISSSSSLSVPFAALFAARAVLLQLSVSQLLQDFLNTRKKVLYALFRDKSLLSDSEQYRSTITYFYSSVAALHVFLSPATLLHQLVRAVSDINKVTVVSGIPNLEEVLKSCSFVYSKAEYREQVHSSFDEAIEKWKIDLCDTFLDCFKRKFANSEKLAFAELMSLMELTVALFKPFYAQPETNLCSSDGDLLTGLIDEWQHKLQVLLSDKVESILVLNKKLENLDSSLPDSYWGHKNNNVNVYLREVAGLAATNISLHRETVLADTSKALLQYFVQLRGICRMLSNDFMRSVNSIEIEIEEDLDIGDDTEAFTNEIVPVLTKSRKQLQTGLFATFKNAAHKFIVAIFELSKKNKATTVQLLAVILVFHKCVSSKELDTILDVDVIQLISSESASVISFFYASIIDQTVDVSTLIMGLAGKRSRSKEHKGLSKLADSDFSSSSFVISSYLKDTSKLILPIDLEIDEHELWEDNLPVTPSSCLVWCLHDLSNRLTANDTLGLYQSRIFKDLKNRVLHYTLESFTESLEQCQVSSVNVTSWKGLISRVLYFSNFLGSKETLEKTLAVIRNKMAEQEVQISEIDEQFMQRKMKDCYNEQKCMFLPLSS